MIEKISMLPMTSENVNYRWMVATTLLKLNDTVCAYEYTLINSHGGIK